MTGAVVHEGNDRDAGVVEEICGYLTGQPPQSFFLFAGAGSGKTRTLVEVLRRLTGIVPHESGGRLANRLRLYGRSIRVVTYTKNAVAVISGRLGSNDLVAVSTIHSFCWELIGGFDEDIREALIADKAVQLEEAKAKAAAKVRGISDTDRRKFSEIEAEMEALKGVPTFMYHPDKDTYGEGAMQHGQVLDATAWLLLNRPTLQTILQDRHPIILIDESQDTMKSVLDALMKLAEPRGSGLTLGLLGDHRQRIYMDGHSDLPSLVPPGWAKPELKMNHRSQQRVVQLINKIWAAKLAGRMQPSSGVEQHHRTEKTGGTVRLFIGHTSLATPEKRQKEAWVASQMQQAAQSDAWATPAGYQSLALEHKLVAARGDFLNVYTAMTLIDPNAVAPTGRGENTGPSAARLVLQDLAQVAACVAADGSVNDFAVTEILRRAGCLDQLPTDVDQRIEQTEEMHEALAAFGAACVKPDATVAEVVAPIIKARMFKVDARLLQQFADQTPPPAAPIPRKETETEDARRRRGWCALFKAPWAELERYRRYLAGNSELATHQVVKGSEFTHVMVVMDDEQSGGNQISYDKLFGATELGERDLDNVQAGKETTIDRSLRLLYVTCSRARESLALVLWAENPTGALKFARHESGWFAEGEVLEIL
ncbi:UvrD-helicase domain-containing protein [Variovorax saccharolyticus]|uniref:UvrD-helicase domain-containing protein n=1 Tax=Variovorax saccharolyticus TaxID=3053516 RepID=UPI002577A429|nr:UvrD-helicase domain-containing protein [Variovorax sp. J31P216]MDM0029849.1 UvrD-helicase domain-containing protein [Variovorax sp. J31P216]